MHERPYSFPNDFFFPPRLVKQPSYLPPLIAGRPLLQSRSEKCSPRFGRQVTPDFKRTTLQISNSCKAVGRRVLETPMNYSKLKRAPFYPDSSLPQIRPMVYFPSQQVLLLSVTKPQQSLKKGPDKSLKVTFNLTNQRRLRPQLVSFRCL
jgi:hypothetical protein